MRMLIWSVEGVERHSEAQRGGEGLREGYGGVREAQSGGERYGGAWRGTERCRDVWRGAKRHREDMEGAERASGGYREVWRGAQKGEEGHREGLREVHRGMEVLFPLGMYESFRTSKIHFSLSLVTTSYP